MNNIIQAVLELKDVHVSYKSGDEQLQVLKGADFTLNSGEIVALVAPSGTGKSTLLHVAGLLEKPTKGEIFVNGQNTAKLSEKDRTVLRLRSIGFVYQFHHLLPEFTAVENVMMPQMIDKKSKSLASKKAKEWLEKFDLGHRVHHQPGKLSGGEKQRVAIARALANSPHILLADEPTGNLDEKTSDHVFNLLLQAVRQEGLAALIVTHNNDLASKMDRVMTLHEGKIVPFTL
ncbi:ABC transporter ATP-binding protein [Commensalibacter communis]|uniref:ABC transporter ATP-binding protein n=1 Tax=Commensalibacter communis TaxID=2972786 RepID=UPI0022FF885F|nr:ABC transporter ATP-binding protein [Commensalibacter communis]CAI3933197.1 ABC-type lipoprotein export system [Commensalibacter communis]CAI3944990.1 ABC-type lipoprotein export system [Commensalibacter communis]